MKGRNNNLRNRNIRERYPLNDNTMFLQNVIRTLNSCNRTNIELSTNFYNLANNNVVFEEREKDLIIQCLNMVFECQKIINYCQWDSFRRVQILNNLNARMTHLYNIRKFNIEINRATLPCDIQNRVINNNMNDDRKNANQKSSDIQCSSTTYEINKNNTNEDVETVEIISSGSIKKRNEMGNESKFQKQHLEEECIPKHDIGKGKGIIN